MTTIYSFYHRDCTINTNSALVRDLSVKRENIVSIPDSSYFERMKPSNSVFVVPGGSLFDHIAAFSNRHEHIKELVKDGMSYVGICAGAALACHTFSYVDTVRNEPISYRVSEESMFGEMKSLCKGKFLLGIINAASSGPNFALNPSYKGSNYPGKTVEITFKGQKGFLYWNKSIDLYGASEIAFYSPSRSAIVASDYGFGKVVLSGSHPELSFKDLHISDRAFWDEASDEGKKMIASESFRLEIMREIGRLAKIKA